MKERKMQRMKRMMRMTDPSEPISFTDYDCACLNLPVVSV